MIRVDMAERIAPTPTRRAPARRRGGRPALVTSLGPAAETVARLMRDIGFRPSEAAPGWIWRGRERRRPPRRRETPGSPISPRWRGLKRG